jgi:membrane protease subunit HflK
MRADLQTYRTGAGAALKGLVFQVVLAVAALIYGLVGKDAAAITGTMFMGIGVLAWLALLIVYDQHRRERIEAMEMDALAASAAAGTSVFEGKEDFRPAAARLASLYRWFVPIVSLVCGGLLVGLGVWRYLGAVKSMPPLPAQPGWALGLGLGLGALAFVVARYMAGLGKQPAWANLRAGAAFAVGSSLIWLAIGIAHLVQYMGTDSVVRWLPVGIAVFLVVIGVETFLHFVLAVYRPRRAGELPRPAFESRLLGFAAAPDRIAQSISDAINYQLGFDVTSGWAYQLLARATAPLLLVGALVTWLMTSVVVVQPHQRAMILRFGQPVRVNLEPGWHFKWMWPFESAYVPEFYTRSATGKLELKDRTVTGLRRVELGTLSPATREAILWTNDHATEEVWQYVRIGAGATGTGMTDIAAVSVEIPMQYAVRDVFVYDLLGAPDQRDDMIRAVARREATRFFQTMTLDDILAGDRASLSARLRGRIQAALDALNPDESGRPRGAGVEIVFLGIVGAHPPKDPALGFETPVQAAQRREANIRAAETDANEVLTKVAGDAQRARQIVMEIERLEAMRDLRRRGEAGVEEVVEQEIRVQNLLATAGGEAASLLAAAAADRWTAHMGSRALAARYAGQVALFEACPDWYRASRFFEAFAESMQGSRVYIVSDQIRDLGGVMDLKDVSLGVDVFRSDKEGK